MPNEDTAAAAENGPPVADPEGCAEAPGEAGDAAAGASPVRTVESLARELEAALGEAQTQRDAALRAHAEMDNLRKRVARDIENAHKFALERFMGELLGVLDSFELGISAARDAADVNQVREGMELTLKMFSTATDKVGLEVVDPVGAAFNPERHQAMSMQESNEVESGTVLMVVQKGYVLNERLIRPAMVVVSK